VAAGQQASIDDLIAVVSGVIQGHICPRESRGVDLETADQFCIDCGDVTSPYGPGAAGRFPGRKASDLITEELKKEFPGAMVQTQLHYVEAVSADEFNVLIDVQTRKGGGHRQYRLIRHGVDETFELTLMGKS
jgi:hypothetical protein